MCVDSIDVARDEVERLFIIDVEVEYKPEIAPQGGLFQQCFQAREAQRVSSHYE